MNAVTVDLARSLERALLELGDASVVVVRGAGGNFSVGGDYHELAELRARGPDAVRELMAAFRDACRAVAQVEVPVVAAVEGYAVAGGFELMQSCDIALVREDARIADHHLNMGMVPGGGGSQRLPRLVGRQRALAHILSGDRLTGSEAVAWGLAYRAYAAEDFEPGVEELAERLAAKDSEALAQTKRLVHEGLTRSLEAGLELELEAAVRHVASDRAMELFARAR